MASRAAYRGADVPALSVGNVVVEREHRGPREEEDCEVEPVHHVPHVHEVLDRATADDLDPLEQHEDGTHAHGVDDVPGEGWGWGWGVGCQ